jgi:hypothetical protein
MKTPEQRYKELFEEMNDLCEREVWGDPFSYARSREILMACELGHTIAPTLSGADAFDEDGECEYKSTIAESIKGSYTGISVQPTWEEQVKYLKEDKIAKYKNHYYGRFAGGKIAEIWRLDGERVFDILLPKLEKKFPTILTKKDPRLSADVTKTEIYKYGERMK